MKALDAGLGAVFRADLGAQRLCLRDRGRLETEPDRLGESLGRELRVWNRGRAGLVQRDQLAPERLVAEKGDDGGWSAQSQSSRCGAGAAVMDDAGYAREQPVVRTVA